MRYRGDEDMIAAHAIEKGERIPREDISTLAVPLNRPPLWSFSDCRNCVFELEQKTLRRNFAAFSVPSFVLRELLLSFRMKADELHPRR